MLQASCSNSYKEEMFARMQSPWCQCHREASYYACSCMSRKLELYILDVIFMAVSLSIETERNARSTVE